MSQYYVSPININPALVGSSDLPLVTTQYRSQWNDFAYSYPINIASAIYPITQPYSPRIPVGGLGVAFVRERAGMQGWLTHTELQLAGAYNLPIDFRQKHVISLGLATSYLQRTLNFESIRWGSQYDATVGYDPSISSSVPVVRNRLGYFSADAGIVWSYNSFKNTLISPWEWTSGLTISHLNRPDVSFTDSEQQLPVTLTWHGSASYRKYYWKISPQALVLWQQSRYHINIGAYTQYQVRKNSPRQPKTVVMGGLWYRWGDAVALSGGLQHHNVQLACSVDFAQYPSLGYYSVGGAWEVSLVIMIPTKNSTYQRRSTPLI
mgnify:CR=1 FL=1